MLVHIKPEGARVGVVMGSRSDWETLRHAVDTLAALAVPHDAVRYACAIAPAGCTVHLVHVVEVAAPPNPLYAHHMPGRRATPEEHAELDRGLESALRALVPLEAERRGIETETHVAHYGRPGEVIRALGERLGVDVICLGTHGRSGLSRLLGGSVAREIAT